MLAPQTRPYPARYDRPVVLGHRGASAQAPENTLAAFREAMRQGADGVELDAMRCGSGELVVCHDAWLDRVAGAHLEVEASTLQELKALDVGSRFSAGFAGERIPTLAEALAALPREAVCNIELKCDSLRDRGLSHRVAREVRRSEAQGVVLSSFNPLSLVRARLFAPRLPVAMLVDAAQNLPAREAMARGLSAAALHVEHRLCSHDTVARWHGRGFKVAAFTVDEAGDIERCCLAGVDVLITNQPRATLATIDRLGLAD
jgi:glycerophosphoryl diester phosphodiesterase